ncbi:hypothetical protein Tco_0871377 [Tanacetum coccineum]
MGLPEDIYDAVDSCETAQEIWLRVQQMMKGSDIGIQDKKAKLFNEWERFTSTDGESIESYYHCFSKLMNDFKRNKHFPEKIASNLKFLNNLQPEWRRHVTIFHQTKDLHEVDYTQLYDFLKYNQAKVNKLRAERLARAHDPLALMANSNNPYNYPVFHQDQPSSITYMQQPQPNNNFISQPSFNTNYMQQPMPNPEEITDPTTAINMALADCITGYEYGQERQMQMVGGNGGNQFRQNQNGLIVVPGIVNKNPNGNGNVVAARAEVRQGEDAAYLQTQLLIAQKKKAGIQLQAEKFDLMAAAGDLDEIKEFNANCILMANFSAKTITALNEEITNLNNQLSKEKSTVSFLNEEKKKLKSDFKIRKDKLLDKQIQLENKIKELDNILVKTGQLIQTMHMLSPKPDSFYHTKQKMALGYQNPFYLKQAQQKQQSLYNGKVLLEKHDPPVVYDSEETLQLAQESRLKMKQLNKEIKPANYAKINQLSRVFVFQKAKSREELYFSNTSNTATISKLISIPNEEFSDDTSPSVAQKFLNEECKYDKISYDKAYNDMQQKIERLQAQLGDFKGKSQDTPCVSDTLNPLSQKLENENVELEINPLKTSWEDKFVPINKVRASVKTNPITVSQPHVITNKDVNFDSNGLSSTRVDNTAKTRRPQPKSNIKNNRIPSVSKSSCIKNKEVEV